MIFNGKKAQEKGSIMLEVIAVLALMGVMGAMLFRQIYLRNQELHNVQMASEMRTVKEAFSACIQARPQEIMSSCSGTIAGLGAGQEGECNYTGVAGCIKEYLPSGWFAEEESGDPAGTALKNHYNFYTYVYKQADSSQKVKIYGLVVPQEQTLPATGWNFKRAARVALLIGADGGAYGPDITTEKDKDNPSQNVPIIAGSLGTWSLSPQEPIVLSMPQRDSKDIPTYVAITGLDVFTPEYDVPKIDLHIPGDDLQIQFDKLGAASLFMAGYNTSNCVATINHKGTTPDSNGFYGVNNDTLATIGTNCLPTFWVDPSEPFSAGAVYTRGDLNVGYDTTNPKTGTPAIKLTKGGAIIFAQTDPDLQNTSDSTTPRPYVLDPGYTSVMNDIKLTSRGGARLSDILPNYILKTQKEISSGDHVTKPSCPQNYKKALVVLPTSRGSRTTKVTIPALTIDDSENTGATGQKPYNTQTESKTNVPVSSTEVTIPNLKVSGKTKEKTGVELYNNASICVKIGTADTSKVEETAGTEWIVTLGEIKDDGSCVDDGTIKAIAQTYCVYDETTTVPPKDRPNSNSDECDKMGGTFNSDNTCSFPKVS